MRLQMIETKEGKDGEGVCSFRPSDCIRSHPHYSNITTQNPIQTRLLAIGHGPCASGVVQILPYITGVCRGTGRGTGR